jgi:uncharacterized membrane protein YgdD (TMEM256/DUF423 family)
MFSPWERLFSLFAEIMHQKDIRSNTDQDYRRIRYEVVETAWYRRCDTRLVSQGCASCDIPAMAVRENRMAGRSVRETGERTGREAVQVHALHTGLILGGVSGAAGVMLSAVAAHSHAGALIDTAARMLLVHAAAFVALGLAARIQRDRLLILSMALLSVGLGLFCGDLVARAFVGSKLFAMAAPVGGSMLILGWVAVTLAGLVAIFRRP